MRVDRRSRVAWNREEQDKKKKKKQVISRIMESAFLQGLQNTSNDFSN